jgi:Ras-related protein Rab-23
MEELDFDDFETSVKVIVVGNGGVGKTSMTARYCKNIFTNEYKKTIGVDFLEKVIEFDDMAETVRLYIWDTAGQEEFDGLTSKYYKGAACAVIVFSTIDRDSFDAVETWQRKVMAECGRIPMVLVQNKVDLLDQAKMSQAEVEATASRMGVRLYRTCVKKNENVAEVFEWLTTQHIRSGGDTSAQMAVAGMAEHQASHDVADEVGSPTK